MRDLVCYHKLNRFSLVLVYLSLPQTINFFYLKFKKNHYLKYFKNMAATMNKLRNFNSRNLHKKLELTELKMNL